MEIDFLNKSKLFFIGVFVILIILILVSFLLNPPLGFFPEDGKTMEEIKGKSTREALSVLASRFDQLSDRVTLLENQVVQEQACRRMEELSEEAEYIYGRGYHILITGGTINDFIKATEKQVTDYLRAVQSKEVLCPPSEQSIENYCQQLAEPSSDLAGSESIIDCQEEDTKETITYLRDDYCLTEIDPSEATAEQLEKLDKLKTIHAEYLELQKICP